MELFLRSTALVLITVIFGLLLSGQNKSFALMLSLSACCLVIFSLVGYLEPLLDLLEQITELAGVSGQMLSMLLKAAGIYLIAHLAQLICKDAGQSALANVIGLMANVVILWISIPLVEELLELMQEVLGSI